MAQPINRYKADLRDFRFLLFDLADIDRLATKQDRTKHTGNLLTHLGQFAISVITRLAFLARLGGDGFPAGRAHGPRRLRRGRAAPGARVPRR